MDWVKVVYASLMLVSGILIFIALFTPYGDERKKYINAKAQSYSFMVVVGILILETVRALYLALKGTPYHFGSGISPLVLLSLISVIYLVTLLVYRRKYGD